MVLIFTAASLWADAATELSAKLSAGNWDTYARLPGECPEDTVKELIAKLAAGNWNTYALSGESPEDTVKDLLNGRCKCVRVAPKEELLAGLGSYIPAVVSQEEPRDVWRWVLPPPRCHHWWLFGDGELFSLPAHPPFAPTHPHPTRYHLP